MALHVECHGDQAYKWLRSVASEGGMQLGFTSGGHFDKQFVLELAIS